MKTLDVFPGLSLNDFLDVVLRRIESLGDFSLRNSLRAKFANFHYRVNIQCRGSSTGFCDIVTSAFPDHVVHVVGVSALKKMIGVYAGRVIAFMKNFHSFSNRTVMKFVRNAMRSQYQTSAADAPVSICSNMTLPFPTIIPSKWSDILPERFGYIVSLLIVTNHESSGMALAPHIPVVMTFGKGSVLLAAALTFAVRMKQSVLGDPRGVIGYVVGKVCSMIGVHKKLAFLVPSLGTFDDVAEALRVWFTPVIVSQVSG